jgi:hypothetical protein
VFLVAAVIVYIRKNYLKNSFSYANASIVDQNARIAMGLLDLFADFLDGSCISEVAAVKMHVFHYILVNLRHHLQQDLGFQYLRLASSGGKACTSNTTILATFANPTTIAYPKPLLPPVITINSSFPGPNLKGAPERPKAQLFHARVLSAWFARLSTPTPVSTLRIVIKVASLESPFFAKRLVWKGRNSRSRICTGPLVKRYKSAPVKIGSLTAFLMLEVTVVAMVIQPDESFTRFL